MTAFLIARTVEHAISTAQIDRRWERVGPDKFVTPSGEAVQVIARAESLRGQPRGTRVFLGYHWWENPDSHMIQEMHDAGCITVPDLGMLLR